jgi:hypothetical protein
MTSAPIPASSKPQCSAVSSANSTTRSPRKTPGLAEAEGLVAGMVWAAWLE